MAEGDRLLLAESFETHRPHLRSVAYRMLGSAAEADDAVQDAWLRLSRSGAGGVDNLGGWLGTVVSRLCLDQLRSRRSRREEPLGWHLAEGEAVGDPEGEAVLIDSVGRALLVVLDRLEPAERVAFVLHDMFAVPFDEIAPIVDRTPVAAKKLASRARHRVQGTPTISGSDLRAHRHVVDAFLAAARQGDVAALLAVLAPDVVRRADHLTDLRGAESVAEETRTYVARAQFTVPALIDGLPGLVVAPAGRLLLAIRLTIEHDKVTAMDVVTHRDRLARLDLALLDGS
jgi:RNA polymerase sigma factor (sigma-70 family)